jgi:hypothetical protein
MSIIREELSQQRVIDHGYYFIVKSLRLDEKHEKLKNITKVVAVKKN